MQRQNDDPDRNHQPTVEEFEALYGESSRSAHESVDPLAGGSDGFSTPARPDTPGKKASA